MVEIPKQVVDALIMCVEMASDVGEARSCVIAVLRDYLETHTNDNEKGVRQ